jgi:hypothetical protein
MSKVLSNPLKKAKSILFVIKRRFWEMKDPYKYGKTDRERLAVLKHQEKQLEGLSIPTPEETLISESEQLLQEFGYGEELEAIRSSSKKVAQKTKAVLPDWDTLVQEALRSEGENVGFYDLFSEEEITANREVIAQLNDEYNAIHRLDGIDWAICVVAGILSAPVDILFVGFPQSSKTGSVSGPLSEKVREYFKKVYPPDKMEKLSQLKRAKTPYDAQDNRNTAIRVEGLSADYHRLYELGHDPLLGFVIGVMDIMKGTMTTIDANGKIVRQVVQSTEYMSRREQNIFKAIAKEFIHLKTDINTPAGLPAPFMGVFNLFQFGSIGEEDNTIADVVRGMYYDKYDFVQFCASSIPVMLTEVIVRISWAIKRVREGHNIKESIPVQGGQREKRPKLQTMLFIAHSIATAANAGKIMFTPDAHKAVAINVPQWMAFAKYSFSQLKWVLIEKPELRERYVMRAIEDERYDIIDQVNQSYADFFDNAAFEMISI